MSGFFVVGDFLALKLVCLSKKSHARWEKIGLGYFVKSQEAFFGFFMGFETTIGKDMADVKPMLAKDGGDEDAAMAIDRIFFRAH